jgi:hypothetical protein
MKRILNGLVFALIALPAAAQEQEPPPWYEVEIILFENLDPAAMNSEQWPQEVAEPNMEGSIELLRKAPQPEPVPDETTPTQADTSEAAPQPPAVIETPQTTPAAEPIQPEAGEQSLEASTDTTTQPAANGSPNAPVPYLILPPEQYRLNEAYQKLVDSEDYLPLLHVAWRQIIPPREKPDHIFIDDQLDDPLPNETVTPEEVPPLDQALPADGGTPEVIPPVDEAPPLAGVDLQPGSDTTGEDSFLEQPLEVTPPIHTLSGIISIGVGRYLHVGVDLLLYKPQLQNMDMETGGEMPPAADLGTPLPPLAAETPSEGEDEAVPPPEFFRIQGNLRMRSGEVHYLDHPLVGMLILFTPYTPPEPPPEAQQPAAPDTPAIDPNQSDVLPSQQ